MANDAYKNAQARRELLLQELAKVEQFLAMYDQFSSGRENVVTSARPEVKSTAEAGTTGTKKRNLKALKPDQIAGLAKSILAETGHPMTRGELAKAIEAKGFNIKADDKPRHVGTILWRKNTEFVNVDGRGYWLVGEPVPELASN